MKNKKETNKKENNIHLGFQALMSRQEFEKRQKKMFPEVDEVDEETLRERANEIINEVKKLQEESKKRIKRYEERTIQANSLRKKGIVLQDQKDFKGATELYLEGLQFCQEIGNIVGIVTFLDDLGTIDLYSKNYTAALQKYNEAYSVLSQEGLEDSSLAQTILRNIQHINEIK